MLQNTVYNRFVDPTKSPERSDTRKRRILKVFKFFLQFFHLYEICKRWSRWMHSIEQQRTNAFVRSFYSSVVNVGSCFITCKELQVQLPAEHQRTYCIVNGVIRLALSHGTPMCRDPSVGNQCTKPRPTKQSFSV